MQPVGHSLAHFAHPTQTSGSAYAKYPCFILIASFGQTIIHVPQAIQFFLSTDANFFDTIFTPSSAIYGHYNKKPFMP